MSKWVNQFRSKVKKIIPHSKGKRTLDETYDFKDTLGGGIFSVVKKAVNKKTGELVAIKIYDKTRLSTYDKECTNTEVELLRALKHPNIIVIKDCIDTRSKRYLVEELMNGGDLLEAIRKKKKFNEKEACRLFSQVLNAIAFLHANGIAHRDIKPDNMLLSSESDDAIVKLADFGFAKKIGTLGTLNTPCGSPVYTAPEIVREDTYDKSVDVWSAGVLLYIMLCGYPPFYHRNPAKLFDEIKKAVFEFPAEQWGSVSNSAKHLVSCMLKADPSDRITAQQALEHPWIVLMRSESNESISAAKPESPPMFHPVSSSPSTSTISSSPSPVSSISPISISTSTSTLPSSTSISTSTSTTLPSSVPSTTVASADEVMDRKIFKAKVNKVLDQGTQFNLLPVSSSPIWARRALRANLLAAELKNEKIDNNDNNSNNNTNNNNNNNNNNNSKNDRSERSDKSDKSEKSNKSNKSKQEAKEGKKERKRSVADKQEGGGGEIKRNESDDRSEMMSSMDAFSLSRCSSTASEEDAFGFPNE